MRNAKEVLVIGGGPAGLAAAIALRGKGFSVTVADGAKPAIDKACGEGLLPGTLAALGELGIRIQTGEGQIFRRIRFIDGAILAEAEFTDEGAIGVRRTVLHQKMVERAKECGVELLWNSPVTAMFAGGAIVGEKRFMRSGSSARTEFIRASGAGPAWRQACTAKCGLRRGGTIARCFPVIVWRSTGVRRPWVRRFRCSSLCRSELRHKHRPALGFLPSIRRKVPCTGGSEPRCTPCTEGFALKRGKGQVELSTGQPAVRSLRTPPAEKAATTRNA